MPICRFIVSVTSVLGLHARPSAEIAQLVLNHKSNVIFRDPATNSEAIASSMISLLSLGCSQFSTIEVEVDGEDAEILSEKIQEYFSRNWEGSR